MGLLPIWATKHSTYSGLSNRKHPCHLPIQSSELGPSELSPANPPRYLLWQEATSLVGRTELGPGGQLCSLLPLRGSLGGTPPHNSFSQQGDNSYDFLSAEEKECLLFLEKTIGSLEAEADSGLSTEESEPATSPQSFRTPLLTQQTPQGKRPSREAALRPVSPSEWLPSCLPSATSF